MNKIKALGLGDHYSTNNPEEIIRNYALGSCVALIIMHLPSMSCGMAHVALPDSNFTGRQKPGKPGYFADTAVPCLVKEVLHLANLPIGAANQLQAKLAGGSHALKQKHYDFQIGERIVRNLTTHLKGYDIPIIGRDIGGTRARTVSVVPGELEVVINDSTKRWII